MKKRGFTALELLISLAIMGLIAGVVLNGLTEYRKTRALEKTADQVEAFLQQARFSTISSIYQKSYGVHFTPSSITLYDGSYATGQQKKTIHLDSYIEISDININGGGSDVYFNRLTGEATTTATIEIRLKEQPERTKTIEVSSSGIVTVE